jgi:hypothetical protein
VVQSYYCCMTGSDDACMPMQVLFLPIKQYETPTRTAAL